MDVNLTISLMRGQMGVVIEKAVNAAVETVLGEMIRVVSLKFEEFRREMTAKEKENENIRNLLEMSRCQMKTMRKYVNALTAKEERQALQNRRQVLVQFGPGRLHNSHQSRDTVPPRRNSATNISVCGEIQNQSPLSKPAHITEPTWEKQMPKTLNVLQEPVSTESYTQSAHSDNYAEEIHGPKLLLGSMKAETASATVVESGGLVAESSDPLWGQTPPASSEVEHTDTVVPNLVTDTSEVFSTTAACDGSPFMVKQEESEVAIVQVKEEPSEAASSSTSEAQRIELCQQATETGPGLSLELPVTQQCHQIPGPSISDSGFVSMDPSTYMSTKRKSYSVEYKKGIVEDSRGKNLTAFCKEKMLSIRLVRKWRADYGNLSQQVDNGNAKKHKCGSGRQPLFSELEDLICEWVVDRRAKALFVNRAQIQEFALAMAPQFEIAPEEFKASQHWLDNFLQRSELSLRRSTILFRLEDTEIIKRAFAFKSFIDDADFSKYNLSNMIAMDETAVFMGHASQTTIEQQGASSVYIPSTAYESARVTCILAIRLDGTKVPPLIISKGKKEKIECVSGMFILETEKAWATQAVIRKWVDLMLPLGMQGSQRRLLVWDAASTHRTKDMKKFLHERKIDQIMIPAGMTAYLQTLDIAVNKPFKDNLHMEMNDYIEKRMERNQRGNFVKPKLQEVVTWVKNSWEKITDSCIANALRAGYLDKKYSFKDSAIARHERFGPMILKEMESQEIHQEIQGLDCYDDVPEDDDMTVIE